MVLLNFVSWFVLSLLIGFIASKVVNLRGDDPKGGILTAVLAGVVMGVVVSLFTTAGLNGWDRMGLLGAGIGAAAAATIWHLVRSKYVSHAAQTTRSSY